jgi:hypothetical protein
MYTGAFHKCRNIPARSSSLCNNNEEQRILPLSHWKSQLLSSWSSVQRKLQQGQTTSPKQSANKVTMDAVHCLVISLALHMNDMSPVISFQLRVSESAITWTNKNEWDEVICRLPLTVAHILNEVHRRIVLGTVPAKLFSWKRIRSMLVNAPNSGRIVELKELLTKLASVRDVKFAIDRGNDLPIEIPKVTNDPNRKVENL